MNVARIFVNTLLVFMFQLHIATFNLNNKVSLFKNTLLNYIMQDFSYFLPEKQGVIPIFGDIFGGLSSQKQGVLKRFLCVSVFAVDLRFL